MVGECVGHRVYQYRLKISDIGWPTQLRNFGYSRENATSENRHVSAGAATLRLKFRASKAKVNQQLPCSGRHSGQQCPSLVVSTLPESHAIWSNSSFVTTQDSFRHLTPPLSQVQCLHGPSWKCSPVSNFRPWNEKDAWDDTTNRSRYDDVTHTWYEQAAATHCGQHCPGRVVSSCPGVHTIGSHFAIWKIISPEIQTSKLVIDARWHDFEVKYYMPGLAKKLLSRSGRWVLLLCRFTQVSLACVRYLLVCLLFRLLSQLVDQITYFLQFATPRPKRRYENYLVEFDFHSILSLRTE